MLGKRCQIGAEALGALCPFILGLLRGTPQGFLDRSAGRRTAEGALGPRQELLVDFDGRASCHTYIVAKEDVHINDVERRIRSTLPDAVSAAAGGRPGQKPGATIAGHYRLANRAP